MSEIDLQIPGLYIICASQGSGKSHLIHYLMYKLRKDFAYGLVFTNTFFDNNPFEYIPLKYIHPEYDEKVLEGLMDLQAELVDKGVEKEAFVIFDDCIDDKDEFTSPVLKRLTTQLRHYHITVIFSTQYCNALPPRMRTNAMGVFIFKTDTEISLRALYESYGQTFGAFSNFRDFVMKNTGDFKFIYYNKFVNGEIEDKYKIMRAPEHIPEFKIKY